MRRQEDLPQVLATPFEMMRAASGHPITVSTLDGAEVCLRIPTADELAAKIAEAQAGMQDGGPGMPSRAEIERFIAPLPI